MRAVLVATALIGLMALSAGCGDGGDDGTTVADPGPTTGTAATTTTTTETGGEDTTAPQGGEGGRTVEVWFGQGVTLYVTRREIGSTLEVGTAAVEAMLAGPTEAELAAGVGSAVPVGSKLRALTVSDGIATVDLSRRFASGNGLSAEMIRLAQLVYTLTQFNTVDSVALEIEGKPVKLFGSHGIEIDGPLARSDVRGVLPKILVTSPQIGETVTSPIKIAGTANVFEANVSIRIRDADGNRLTSTFTTASCGSGCRGEFSKAVKIGAGYSGPATIVLFESSAEDGSKLNTVKIPVTVGG